MRIRHFGGFAEAGDDGAVEEAHEGDGTQGGGNDGAASIRQERIRISGNNSPVVVGDGQGGNHGGW